MVPYYGDFAEDDTVQIPFNTFSSDDPSASVTVTDLVDADIMVHKDGGLTQIATDGASVIINFDSITGNHLITIDTSAHADYTTGSEYQVRIEGATVDGATINAWVGAFSIERAGGVLALIKDATSGLAKIATDTAAVLVDTDVIDDGTSGLVKIASDVAAILVDTDVIDDGTSGLVKIAADVAAILTDTNELQTDDIPTLIAALPTAAENADAVWDEPKVGHVGAGSVGEEIQSHSLSTEIAALNDVSTAEVNAEVVDVIDVDTRAEPAQGTPGATISLGDKVDFLYKAWRNKSTQTVDTYSLMNDDAATVDHKATVSDDGTTFTKGEVASGP